MVERYNGIERDPEGVYVMFEDFERLTTENRELRRVMELAVEGCTATAGYIQGKLDERVAEEKGQVTDG